MWPCKKKRPASGHAGSGSCVSVHHQIVEPAGQRAAGEPPAAVRSQQHRELLAADAEDVHEVTEGLVGPLALLPERTICDLQGGAANRQCAELWQRHVVGLQQWQIERLLPGVCVPHAVEQGILDPQIIPGTQVVGRRACERRGHNRSRRHASYSLILLKGRRHPGKQVRAQTVCLR